MVRDVRVLGGQTAHRRIEEFEKLLGHARSDLGSIAPRDTVLMQDEEAAIQGR